MKLQTKNHRLCLEFLAVFCLIVFFAFDAAAKTLTEYRDNVKSANDLINELSFTEAEEFSSLADYQDYERQAIKEVREYLPGAENIEWQGATVETGNQWLIDKLEAYEKEQIGSFKRSAILIEIGERLDALEMKLTELESASVSDRTKDDDKRKLSEILNREEYAKPEKKEESWIQSLIREFREWLGGKLPETEEKQAPANTGYQSFSYVLTGLLFAAVLALIGFLFYKFAPFFVSDVRRRTKKEKRERIILGERLSASENAETLFDDAERLAREGNLKQAIRKGYIALLCELNDRKLVRLAQNKTNRDYLRDVRKRHELYKNMGELTDNFERHWYGFEAAAEKDWQDFRSGYKKALGETH